MPMDGGEMIFKYYLATCLNNNSKYIDVPLWNLFYFDNNVHLIFQVCLDINL